MKTELSFNRAKDNNVPAPSPHAKLSVPLPGPAAGHAPEPGVPANHGAVLAERVLGQVGPHPEQVQLDSPAHGPRPVVPGPAAQPQGAGGRDGAGDDPPLRHRHPVHLGRRTTWRRISWSCLARE